jgi:DNA primase
MRGVIVPKGKYRRIILAGDGDTPGISAMKATGKRLREEGHAVSFMVPPADRDWNEVLNDNKAFCPPILESLR